jgi:hypothetical protein
MRPVAVAAATLLSALAIVFGVPSFRSAFASLPTPPVATTGAPGESNCGSCHSGNSGNQVFEIATLPLVTEYVPGNSYYITVGIDDAGMVRWGFEATVLKDSDNTMAGTFSTLVDAHVTTKSSGGITYACHTTNGVTSPSDPPDVADGTWWSTVANGPVAWVFQWTAPPQGTGAITIYASGVAANGDGDLTGDNGYVAQLTLTEGTTTAVRSTTTWGEIKQRYR